MLAVPGALEATLGYSGPCSTRPGRTRTWRRCGGRRAGRVVPTLALCGAEDKRAEVMQDQARHFAGPYRLEPCPGASHFL